MQNGLDNFELIVLKRAELEVDEISEYYELIAEGLGVKFYSEYKDYVETLKNIPFFEVNYTIIRKLPLKKFPYTTHFTINEAEKLVSIHAITYDYQNPENNRLKI